VAFTCFYKFSNSPKAALRFPTTPFLANFRVADIHVSLCQEETLLS
jgi:hypothetical protein